MNGFAPTAVARSNIPQQLPSSLPSAGASMSAAPPPPPVARYDASQANAGPRGAQFTQNQMNRALKVLGEQEPTLGVAYTQKRLTAEQQPKVRIGISCFMAHST